jgi:hypothetical protein
MPVNSWFALSGFSAVSPKLSVVQKKIDVAALLRKNGRINDAAGGAVDTLEISSASKNPDAPKKLDTQALSPELRELVEYVGARNREIRGSRKPDASSLDPDTKKLIDHVRTRNQEIRDSIPKPIPLSAAWSMMPGANQTPRERALATRIGKLDAKMKGGHKLNSEELSFLKQHNPGLYAIAVRVEREREKFRIQLRSCKTDEEKNQLVTMKLAQLAIEAKILIKNNIEPVFVIYMMAAIGEELVDYERQRMGCKARDANERMMDEMADEGAEAAEAPDAPDAPGTPEAAEESPGAGAAGSEGAQAGGGAAAGGKGQRGSPDAAPAGGAPGAAERRRKGGTAGRSADVQIEAPSPHRGLAGWSPQGGATGGAATAAPPSAPRTAAPPSPTSPV